jgi:hypothetical protein
MQVLKHGFAAAAGTTAAITAPREATIFDVQAEMLLLPQEGGGEGFNRRRRRLCIQGQFFYTPSVNCGRRYRRTCNR